MSLKRLLTGVSLGMALTQVALAYQSTGAFLKDADEALTMKQLSQLVPKDRAVEMSKLAQEEDLDLKGPYLVTDDCLRLMKRRGLVGSDFGKLMEAYQAECDRLSEQERLEAIAAWRNLWLDKTSAYVRYVKSLKSVWTLEASNTLDYSSNASLIDPDASSPTLSGDPDVGLGLDGSVKYRPTINREKDLGWGYEAELNGFTQKQASEDALEVDTFSINNGVDFIRPCSGLRKLSLDWNYLRSYSQAPGKERMEYGRHALSLSGASDIKKLDGYFGGYFHTGTVQYRAKEEFPLSGATGEDFNTYVLRYGITLLRSGEGVPFQSYSAGLSYENEAADVNGKRDYSVWMTTLNYSRSLSDFVNRYALSWDSGVSYRMKDASDFAGYPDEDQVMVNTALRAVWNAYASSSISISYLNKNKEKAPDVDQFRIAWTNVITTF